MHGGITRLKEHVGHITGQVEPCPKAPKEIRDVMKMHLKAGKAQRATMKKKKEDILNSLQEENQYGSVNTADDENEEDLYEIDDLEAKQMRQAMKESRYLQFVEEQRRHSVSGGRPSMFMSGAGTSEPTTFGDKRGLARNFSVRQSDEIMSRGVDSHMFSSKQKSVKSMFAGENIKRVGKAISKFFHFNAIPFHAADNPYYQSMIDEIAKAGLGIKGPSSYQIGNEYLDEEFTDLEKYLEDIYGKYPTFGCTLMCDGWSTRTKHPIINFMIYCDRHMIFHSSIDCTNVKKTAEYVFKLMDEAVEAVGEQNVVQVVTDNESSMKAAGQLLMRKRKNLFWSPCAAHCIDLMLEDIGKLDDVKKTISQGKRITSFIYNSDKVVNLMKQYTRKRELLRPGITRFATEFISMESLLRHCTELKRMCTSDEWVNYNSTAKRRTEATEVAELILSERFWKKVRNVCAIMEPLVKVLKTVDQDNKPTLPIIYEAMDRAKMAIQKSVKYWERIWEIIDNRWYNQLHCDLHAAAYFLNPTLQYSGTCEFNLDEVRKGLKRVITKLEPNLDAQVDAINEIKIFTEKRGGFGSSIAKRALSKSLPAEWWLNYGEDAPNLRKIAIKILSQTCTSSGCERNWSTWSLIHTKLRNRLAIQKLHKLVFVHYNMRLKVKNLMYQRDTDDFYNPIDLNHIFHEDDILDDWIRENDQETLSDDNLEWLDQSIRQSESEKSQDDNRRDNDDSFGNTLSQYITKKKKKSVAQSSSQKHKGKARQTSKHVAISSSSDKSDSDDDDDDNSGNGNDGDNSLRQSGGYNSGSQQTGGMSWARGRDNYYATQDTDHGYRPGIEAQREFLNKLTDFSSEDTFSHHSGTQRHRGVDEQMQNLNINPNYDHDSSQNWSTSQPGYGYEQSYGIHTGYYDGSSFDSNNARYGHNSDSSDYRGFGYYNYAQDFTAVPSFPTYVDRGTSSQSSLPQSSHPMYVDRGTSSQSSLPQSSHPMYVDRGTSSHSSQSTNVRDDSQMLPTQNPMPELHFYYHSSEFDNEFELRRRHSTWDS